MSKSKNIIFSIACTLAINNISATETFAKIEADGAGYNLNNNLFLAKPSSLENGVITFNSKTFEPSFPTKRFKCGFVKDGSIDNCANWRSKEAYRSTQLI